MSKITPFCFPVLCLVLSAAAQRTAHAQLSYPDPVATAPVDGSYSVTWAPNCNNAPGISCAFTWLQERVGSSGTWNNVSSGSGSIGFTSKPDGTYYYRVRLGGYHWYYGYVEGYSGTVSVSVADVPIREDILAQMDYAYEVREGYFDSDSKKDIFLRKVSGGTAGNGAIENLILQQGAPDPATNAPTFGWVVPTSSQASSASSWALSAVEPLVHDINIDGYVDVTLNGMSAVASGASDYVVYAPGAPGRKAPIGMKRVDDDLVRFSNNTMDYFFDPDFFVDNAPSRYFHTWLYFAYCPLFGYPGLDNYHAYLFSYCYIDYVYVSGMYRDFSAFSDEALAIWAAEQNAMDGYLSDEEALDNIEDAVEGAIGTQVGGWPMEELLGGSGIHNDSDTRRNIELGQAILGLRRGRNRGANPNEAPPQPPRQLDRIYYTAHHVFMTSNHLALEYTDPLSGGGGVPYVSETISAYPEGGLTPPFGKLWAATDRPTDKPYLNFTVGELDVTNGMTHFQYWNNYLKPRHNRYIALPNSSKADYEPTPYPNNPNPQCICGYNSNSYVSGLPYSGAVKNVPFSFLTAFPGFSYPVPDPYFR